MHYNKIKKVDEKTASIKNYKVINNNKFTRKCVTFGDVLV
jgi:hypothetical protein